jgi:hypothetical protein
MWFTLSYKNTPRCRLPLFFKAFHSGLLLAHTRSKIKEGQLMKDEQVRELLYQALETELGGVQVYTTALRCVENEDLKEEWEEYLELTCYHVSIL